MFQLCSLSHQMDLSFLLFTVFLVKKITEPCKTNIQWTFIFASNFCSTKNYSKTKILSHSKVCSHYWEDFGRQKIAPPIQKNVGLASHRPASVRQVTKTLVPAKMKLKPMGIVQEWPKTIIKGPFFWVIFRDIHIFLLDPDPKGWFRYLFLLQFQRLANLTWVGVITGKTQSPSTAKTHQLGAGKNTSGFWLKFLLELAELLKFEILVLSNCSKPICPAVN